MKGHMNTRFNKNRNKEFLKASWDVRKLCVAGRWREAVLLHHAQKSSMDAGHAMDYYQESKSGTKCVNVRLVRMALKAMKELDRVSRLMYRVNLLEYQGLCAILSANELNREELKENVDQHILELLTA